MFAVAVIAPAAPSLIVDKARESDPENTQKSGKFFIVLIMWSRSFAESLIPIILFGYLWINDSIMLKLIGTPDIWGIWYNKILNSLLISSINQPSLINKIFWTYYYTIILYRLLKN